MVISARESNECINYAFPRWRATNTTRTVSDSLNDLWQHLQAAHRPVDLAPGVVRDDDALAPNLERAPRVRDGLDALDDERATVRDLLPLADEPADLLPGVWLAVPHTRVDPTAFIVRKVGTVLSHEDRIRFSQLVAGGAWIVEPAARSKLMYSSVLMKMDSIRVVRNVDISRTPAKLPGVGGQHQDIEA